MSEVKLPVWSLCPFRSPVLPPAGDSLGQPRSMLGPCLYAGCGLYRVTKVEDGKVVDGLCSIRSLADSLDQLTKLETMRVVGDGQGQPGIVYKG
jgi:hypothetical protein